MGFEFNFFASLFRALQLYLPPPTNAGRQCESRLAPVQPLPEVVQVWLEVFVDPIDVFECSLAYLGVLRLNHMPGGVTAQRVVCNLACTQICGFVSSRDSLTPPPPALQRIGAGSTTHTTPTLGRRSPRGWLLCWLRVTASCDQAKLCRLKWCQTVAG